ncbi:hypothetical protein [Priestia megaterium]|uniref:hypothetical protein n=1 Tax=Priestia megaterium TaxID=1404 RepID=UPI000BF4F2A4|nr:hypothetical protein [Priestia megaterium]PFT49830.1 hypothetical protein COK68_28115 [Priestia megaterium]
MQSKLALEIYKQTTLLSFEITSFIYEFYNHIWNQHKLDKIPLYYDDNIVLYNNKKLTMYEEIKAEINRNLIDIGSNPLIIDTLTCNQSGESNDWDVTAVWKTILSGKGCNYTLGITHFQICNGKITKEIITFVN